jgi:hypothetical protein
MGEACHQTIWQVSASVLSLMAMRQKGSRDWNAERTEAA